MPTKDEHEEDELAVRPRMGMMNVPIHSTPEKQNNQSCLIVFNTRNSKQGGGREGVGTVDNNGSCFLSLSWRIVNISE